MLNLELQGRGQLITALYETSFTKQSFWKIQLSANKLFTALPSSCGGGHSIQWWWICLCYWNPTAGIWWAFCRIQGRDTRRLQSSQLMWRVPSVLQIKLIDLQCNSELKHWIQRGKGNEKFDIAISLIRICLEPLIFDFQRVSLTGPDQNASGRNWIGL